MSGHEDGNDIDIDAALGPADAALRRAGIDMGWGPTDDAGAADAISPAGVTGLQSSPAHQDQAVDVARFLGARLRLFTETAWIDRGTRGQEDYREARLSMLALSFSYAGFSVRAADARQRLFCAGENGPCCWLRDLEQETQARYTLESLGAVQIDLLEDYGTAPDSEADYLVHLHEDHHTQCAFTAYAVPQLRALGWNVEIDASYPFHVVGEELPWYAVVDRERGSGEWFDFELGIEVDGHRINLLPALLDMLDDGGAQPDLGRLHESAPRFVPLPDGQRYLAVPPERFTTLTRVLAELYQGEQPDRLRFPAARSVWLADLDAALAGPKAPFELAGSPCAMTRMHLSTEPMPPVVDADGAIRATLRPYQLDGLRWLQHLRARSMGGVLADDMGLGKTLQTIAHLCLEVRSGRAVRPSLVVAPTSLVGNWRREFERFAPHLRVCVLHGPQRARQRTDARLADVVISTYPVLIRDTDFFESSSYHLLVLDEAQTIKNPKSRSHRAVSALDATHRLCLTGTPIENSLDELWSLFDFLSPGLLGSEMQFRNFYGNPIEQHRDDARLTTLKHAVGPFILRRMKDEVATELPQKTEVVRPVELHGKQRELYESIRVAAHAQVRSAIQKRGVAASTLTILDALMRLRQLCCDPRLVRGEAARFVRESAKYELLFELLPRQLAEGRRVLVFSQFTSMLALIAEGLTERGIGYALLTGATQHRDRAVADFERGDVDVFLISLKAGGTGLNLVSADTVIHYDPWWNPAAQDQATDRAHRIGQTKPVFVYNLIAAGSVEERMLGLQRRKRQLAAGVVGGQDRGTVRLDEAEVEQLLSPLSI